MGWGVGWAGGKAGLGRSNLIKRADYLGDGGAELVYLNTTYH